MKYILVYLLALSSTEAFAMPSNCSWDYAGLTSKRGPRQLSREEVVARDKRMKESIRAMPAEIEKMKASSEASGLAAIGKGLEASLENEGYREVFLPGTKMPAALRAKQPATLENQQVVVKVSPRQKDIMGRWTGLSESQREPLILQGRVIKQEGNSLTIVDSKGETFELDGLYRTEEIYVKDREPLVEKAVEPRRRGPRQLSRDEIVDRNKRIGQSVREMPAEIEKMKASSQASGLSRMREGLGRRLEKEGYAEVYLPGTKMPASLRAKQPKTLAGEDVVIKVSPRGRTILGRPIPLSGEQRQPVILKGRVTKQEGNSLTLVDQNGETFEIDGNYRTEEVFVKGWNP